MDRQEIFECINSELEFIEEQKSNTQSHIVEEFPIASGLEAIRYNLDKANKEWYNTKKPHTTTTDCLRKIAAICVQMGEKYGMRRRFYIEK